MWYLPRYTRTYASVPLIKEQENEDRSKRTNLQRGKRSKDLCVRRDSLLTVRINVFRPHCTIATYNSVLKHFLAPIMLWEA
jgi:hypothetical protein